MTNVQKCLVQNMLKIFHEKKLNIVEGSEEYSSIIEKSQ